jgi:hypothetical protein
MTLKGKTRRSSTKVRIGILHAHEDYIISLCMRYVTVVKSIVTM